MTPYIVVYTPDSGFKEHPKSLNGVCVAVSRNVDALAVIDSLMRVAASVKPLIGAIVICKDNGFRQDVLFNKPSERVRLRVRSNESANFAFALNHSHHSNLCGILGRRATALSAAHVLRPEIAFVHFDSAVESANRPRTFGIQHGANLFEHAPRGFVGDSGFAFDLLGRDSTASRSHEVHGIEPRCQRSWRLVKDRIRCRVNVITAMLAAVRRAALDAVVLRNLLAVLAINAIGIEVVLEPFQTGGIIRELAAKGFNRVTLHLWLAVHFGYLPSSKRLAEVLHTVK